MNAIVAAILSFLIPGLGQAVSGEIQKGIIYFVLAIVIGLIVSFVFRSFFAGIINILYALYVAYDAYKMNQ